MKTYYTIDMPLMRKWGRSKLQDAIEIFWNRPETAYVITWEPGDPWKSPSVMAATWTRAVKTSGKSIRVRKDGDSIWLIKIDPKSPE